jgi:hypothetical protein
VPGTRLTQGGPLSPKVIEHLQDAVEQHAGTAISAIWKVV